MKLKPLSHQISVALLLLALTACGVHDQHPQVTNLADIGQLKSQFNQAKGVPRLILLVSPT